MVNGLLKNKESPSSRGPAGWKGRNRGSRGDAMGPALHTREGEEGGLPPSGSLCTTSSPNKQDAGQGLWARAGKTLAPQDPGRGQVCLSHSIQPPHLPGQGKPSC